MSGLKKFLGGMASALAGYGLGYSLGKATYELIAYSMPKMFKLYTNYQYPAELPQGFCNIFGIAGASLSLLLYLHLIEK